MAPSTPPNVSVTQSGTSFTINWATAPTTRRPHRTSSTRSSATTRRSGPSCRSRSSARATRSRTSPTPTRFFLRAVDEAGNRSATTTAITLVPAGAAAGHVRADRRDLVLQGRRRRPGHRVAEPRHRRLLLGDRCGRARLGRRRRGDRDPGYGDHAVLRQGLQRQQPGAVRRRAAPAAARTTAQSSTSTAREVARSNMPAGTGQRVDAREPFLSEYGRDDVHELRHPGELADLRHQPPRGRGAPGPGEQR